MTHQRRVVRHTIRIQDDHQAVPSGTVVAARLRRDYPDDTLALKLDLWIEREDPDPYADDVVAIVGTNRPAPAYGTHLVTVVDEAHDRPVAWHLYRLSSGDPEADTRALVAIAAASQARHRADTCGATPTEMPPVVDPDPTEQLAWRAVCSERAGHDGSNWHTPHRATGLGRNGKGELTWYDQPIHNAPPYHEHGVYPAKQPAWWRFWERP